MKHTARIVLLALLLAALPLRGYAGVLMVLCESHHGGAVAAEAQAHEHGDSHHHDAGAGASGGAGGTSHAASVCSICASCCAGAGLAPDTNYGVAFQAPDSNRIPFFGRQVSDFVARHLDRPPLPL